MTTENMKSKAGKVNARYVGRFTVKRIVSAVNVELDLYSTVPVFHVSKLTPYRAVNNSECLL